MPSPRCPRCGFSFGWNGRKCDHCPPPSRARQLWEQIGRLEEQVHASKDVTVRQILAIVCGVAREDWENLPEPLQAVVEAVEVGPTAMRKLAPLRPEAFPELHMHFIPAVNTILAAARQNSVPDLWRSAMRVALNCRDGVASRTHPNRELISFSLPPELEQYRAVVARETRNPRGRRRNLALFRRAENDPVRIAYDHLQQQLNDYRKQLTQAGAVAEAAQCEIARDILGYPEVTVAFNPAWRTSTVVAMARGMLESRDFSAMPILADALQDADCEEPEILEHCRAEKPHSAGCWVIDWILAADER